MAKDIKVVPASGMMLLPPAPHLCQICATEHEPHLPHNAQSIFYQMKFKMDHGREATWSDALAHCDREMKIFWKQQLAEHDIHVDLGE